MTDKNTVYLNRGSIWYITTMCAQIAIRFYDTPDFHDYYLGLRLIEIV